MKIGKSDNIKIISKEFNLQSKSLKKIDYDKWIEFIESNKAYFVWYENTEEGIKLSKSINEVPDWAKDGVLYRLNKSIAYSTDKIVKKSYDLIIRYFDDEGIIKVDIEKKMTSEVAEKLLEKGEGAKMKYENFLSTSSEKEVAWNFVKRKSEIEKKVFITVKSKNGKSLEYMRDEMRGEFEMLHKSKSEFIIEEIKFKGEEILNIDDVALEGAIPIKVKNLYYVTLREL